MARTCLGAVVGWVLLWSAHSLEGKNFIGLHAGRFDGLVCLVTGGTSGIGEHAAYHLAQEGCAVVVAGRRAEQGTKVVHAINTLKGRSTLSPSALYVQMDVSDAQSVEAGIAKVGDTYGRLDAVFANAGFGGYSKIAPLTPLEGWKSTIDLNLNGVFYTMRFASQLMQRTGPEKQAPGGTMVLCSSIYGQQSTMNTAAYTASKHALEGLKKSAVMEFGLEIRVNNVGPSFTPSEMLGGVMGTPFEAWAKGNQMGNRFAEQAEVSSVVAWLLSGDSSYVSGQTILVDGGALGSWSPHAQQKKFAQDMADFAAKAEL